MAKEKWRWARPLPARAPHQQIVSSVTGPKHSTSPVNGPAAKHLAFQADVGQQSTAPTLPTAAVATLPVHCTEPHSQQHSQSQSQMPQPTDKQAAPALGEVSMTKASLTPVCSAVFLVLRSHTYVSLCHMTMCVDMGVLHS